MNFQNNKNILFVSDLPKETTSEDLEKLFEQYHFQAAELINGKTITWAKVYFEKENYAIKAKDELNGEIITPKSSAIKQWRPIRICLYERQGATAEKNIKQSLLVKNLDQRLSQKEFYQLFLKYGEIDSAKIEYESNGLSKGFGYIYYRSSDSAEQAKQNLNGKEYYGKRLDIVNLIPNKSKDFSNSLFVKNFPIDFQENDLKKLFEKYGEVKNVSISRDQLGYSKGFGFVAFADFEMTSRCISEMKQNEISFPGMQPLYVKLATRKEDREFKPVESPYLNEYLRMQFRLIYATGSIDTPEDLEKEIRLFIKVIMLSEYNPKEVIVDFNEYTAIVYFNNKKDYDQYLKMYGDFCLSHAPSFYCTPIIPRNEAPKVVAINPIVSQPNMINRQPNTILVNNNIIHQQQQQHHQQQQNNQIHIMKGNNQGQFQVGMQIPHNHQMKKSNPNIIPINQPFPNMQLVNNNEMQSKFINRPHPNHNNLHQNPYSKEPNIQPMPYRGQQMQLPGNMIIPPTAYPKEQMIPMPMPIYPQSQPMQNARPPFQQPPMMHQNNGQPQPQPQPFNQPNYIVFPNKNTPMIPNDGFMPTYMFNMDGNKYNSNNIPQGHNYQEFPNRKNEEIDQRNLQNLDPVELQSIFNKPAQTMFTPEMMNHDDDEEIAMEIADSIYEIVVKQYPK